MLTFMFPQFSAIKIFSFIFVFFPHFIIKLISKLLQKPLNYKLLNLYTEAMKKILILLRKFSFEQLRSYLIFVHIKIHVSITYVYVFTIICNLYIEKKNRDKKQMFLPLSALSDIPEFSRQLLLSALTLRTLALKQWRIQQILRSFCSL